MKGIIGIGNPLKGDDGIGIVLIKEIEEKVPSNIQVYDVGSGIMKTLHILRDLDKAIIVDAVHFGGEPGDFRFFEPKEAKSLVESKSSHDVDLIEVMELSDQLGELPGETLIMGVEPKDVSFREELSPILKKKLPVLVDELYKKTQDLFQLEDINSF